jgi:hypothetical protein
MLQKWVKCRHVKVLAYYPDLRTEGCHETAKYIEDNHKPVCDGHAGQFVTLRALEPADVEKWGQW